MIGNDVVDLEPHEARGKAADDRFVRRVYTERERRYVRSMPNPDLALWSLWAAKEAAFKIAKRADPDLVPSPIAFEVHGPGIEASHGTASGRIEHAIAGSFSVSWAWNPAFVHCVALPADEAVLPSRVSSAVAEGEALCRSEPLDSLPTDDPLRRSRAVRLLATRLFAESGFPGVTIVRPESERGPGPPVAVLDDEPIAGSSVSLSHDGRWVAAALLRPPAPAGRRAD